MDYKTRIYRIKTISKVVRMIIKVGSASASSTPVVAHLFQAADRPEQPKFAFLYFKASGLRKKYFLNY